MMNLDMKVFDDWWLVVSDWCLVKRILQIFFTSQEIDVAF